MQDEILLREYEVLKDVRKGRPDWTALAARMTPDRTAESCRLRFTHVLQPRIQGLTTNGPWSQEEVWAIVIFPTII